MGQVTLRITIEETDNSVDIKLEGRVAGPWTDELRRLWSQTAPSLNRRKVLLDLRNTTYADSGGLEALREIYLQTGAEFAAGTPWTQYLAEEVKSGNNPLDQEP
jgi:anti-anti-sigma regulatory factor